MNTLLGAKAMRIQPAPKVCMSKAKERGLPIMQPGVLASMSWTWPGDGTPGEPPRSVTVGASKKTGDLNYEATAADAIAGFWRVTIFPDLANLRVLVMVALERAGQPTIDWMEPYLGWQGQFPSSWLNISIPSPFGSQPLTTMLYIR